MTTSGTCWRIVCPQFGELGHTTNTQDSPSLARAKLRVEQNDRLYERLVKSEEGSDMCSYYRSEIGWRVQKQTVTEWETVA